MSSSPPRVVSEELSLLFLKLAGAPPARTDIDALSNKGRKEWCKHLNLPTNGQDKTIKAHLMEFFFPSASQPSSPEVRSTPSSSSRKRSSRNEELISDSEDDSEEKEISLAEETRLLHQTLLRLSSRLDNVERVQAQFSTQKSSAADLDWWVKQVCEFSLGAHVQSQVVAMDHIEPMLETLRAAVQLLIEQKMSRLALEALAKPILKRLIQWLLATMADRSFAEVKAHDTVIANHAAKEAKKWSDDLWVADETIKPDTGEQTVILGIRLRKLITLVAKDCDFKLNKKKEKVSGKSASATKKSKQQPGKQKEQDSPAQGDRASTSRPPRK